MNLNDIFLILLKYLPTDESLPLVMQNLNFPNWKVFEFVTRKTGAAGPTREECIGYYEPK